MSTVSLNEMSYLVAQNVAQHMMNLSPSVVAIISDIPQRGVNRSVAFRVTVWAKEPGPNVAKFVFNTFTEYQRFCEQLTVLDMIGGVPMSHPARQELVNAALNQ